MRFKSIPAHLGKPPIECDDLESLFYSMLATAGVELPWKDYKTSKEMLEYKLRFAGILVSLWVVIHLAFCALCFFALF